MARRILWIEDNPAFHLDLDLILDLDDEAVLEGFEVEYAPRLRTARTIAEKGDVVLVIADTGLDIGADPPEQGLQVVEALWAEALIPESTPVVVRSGYGREHHPGTEAKFPDWFHRDDDRFHGFMAKLLTTLAGA